MIEYLILGEDPNDPLSWVTADEMADPDLSLTFDDVDLTSARVRGETGSQAAPQSQGGQSDKPEGWDASPYRAYPWPPTKTETYYDEDGVRQTRQVVDSAKVEAYYRWQEAREAKAATAEAKRREQEEAASLQEPRIVPAEQFGGPPGEWVEVDAKGNITRFAASQPRQQTQPRLSYDDIILEALLNGQEDKALYFDAFQQRPSRLQALQFAMQYAESEEEFQALFSLAQGPARDYGVAWMEQRQAEQAVQPNPFPAGSREARAFEAGTPAQQQQYNLRQQYLNASGGRLPSDVPNVNIPLFQRPATPATEGPFRAAGRLPGGEVDMPTGSLSPTDASILDAERAERGTVQGPFQSSARTAEKSGGLLANDPFFRGQRERQVFEASLPEGTPARREDDPWKFTSDAALREIMSSPDASPEDRAAAQQEIDRRENIGRQQVAQGPGVTADGKTVPGGSFASFMAGGPDLSSPLTGAEAANLAAGNPYAGKVMSSDPVTGKWTNWVDQNSGEVFSEQAGGGIKTTGVFNPREKPKPVTAQAGPFQTKIPDSVFARRRAARQPARRVFGAPVFVPRR